MFSADIIEITALIYSYSESEILLNDMDEEDLYFPAPKPKTYNRQMIW